MNKTNTAEDIENGAEESSPNPLASQYALHVALQTMKERCLALQQRLTLVEEENLELRMKIGTDNPVSSNNKNGKTDTEVLTYKVGELTRQKFQLTEHIAMVATENRQLWSRLSKLTKDNQNLGNSLNKMKDSISISNSSAASNNLIRSKTFTQNSPNPILRLKKNADIAQQTETVDDENVSLEEISLKVLNEFLVGKAEIEKKCTELMASTPTATTNANSFGFGYLNDETSTAPDSDLQIVVKKCADQMVDMKKELLRQQSDIKVALSSLRQRRSKYTIIFMYI